MENPIEEKFLELKENLQALLEARINLFKLNFAEKLSGILYLVIITIIIMAILGISVTFLSISLANWLSIIVNSRTLGYLLVACLYILIAVIVILLRKKLIFAPIFRNIVSIIFTGENEQ